LIIDKNTVYSRTEKTTDANNSHRKLEVHCLNEALSFVSSSVLIVNLVSSISNYLYLQTVRISSTRDDPRSTANGPHSPPNIKMQQTASPLLILALGGGMPEMQGQGESSAKVDEVESRDQ
jgi:hypothetical protein